MATPTPLLPADVSPVVLPSALTRSLFADPAWIVCCPALASDHRAARRRDIRLGGRVQEGECDRARDVDRTPGGVRVVLGRGVRGRAVRGGASGAGFCRRCDIGRRVGGDAHRRATDRRRAGAVDVGPRRLEGGHDGDPGAGRLSGWIAVGQDREVVAGLDRQRAGGIRDRRPSDARDGVAEGDDRDDRGVDGRVVRTR